MTGHDHEQRNYIFHIQHLPLSIIILITSFLPLLTCLSSLLPR
jgi:hypothetical protein